MAADEQPHFHDCPWWNDGDCTCAERTSYSPWETTDGVLTPEDFYKAMAAIERASYGW